MEVRNIWMPHIPKNGGMTIIENILNYVNANDNFTVDKKNDQFYIVTNNNLGNVIHLYHKNGLESYMKDWLKILVVRNPLDRLISFFNFNKWLIFKKKGLLDKRTFSEFLLDSKNKYDKHGFLYCNATSHVKYLNLKNTEDTYNPLIDKFTVENIFNIFDHIIDLSKINKVYKILETNFLENKITWTIKNNMTIATLNNSQKEHQFSTFTRNDVTTEDLEIFYSIEDINLDVNFYDKLKTKYSLHFHNI